MIAAWVDAELAEAIHIRLEKLRIERPRENISDIIYDALRKYLTTELEEVRKKIQKRDNGFVCTRSYLSLMSS